MDNTALLVMDVQPGIVTRLKDPEVYLKRVQEVVQTARRHQIPVIFVVVGFREGGPEVSPRNKAFQNLTGTLPQHMVNPLPALEREKSDILVVKRRVSAFTGSDLDVVLRSQGIQHLVLAGISTSGVVLSTTREAADKDYQLTILSDLCADFDEEVHQILLTKVFPRQAEVLVSRDWVDTLR
ncbi:MAG: cysteine hydrolase [Spirochaetales bacterium]|nr:cysteine hydrolase [Spirochaetales bacterium]